MCGYCRVVLGYFRGAGGYFRFAKPYFAVVRAGRWLGTLWGYSLVV